MLRSGGALGQASGPWSSPARQLTLTAVGADLAIPGQDTTAFLLLRLAPPVAAAGRGAPLRPHPRCRRDRRGRRGADHPREPVHLRATTGFPASPTSASAGRQTSGLPVPLAADLRAQRPRPASPATLERADPRVGRVRVRAPRGEPRVHARARAGARPPTSATSHIALYVNDFSIHLGDEGRAAIDPRLLQRAPVSPVATASHSGSGAITCTTTASSWRATHSAQRSTSATRHHTSTLGPAPERVTPSASMRLASRARRAKVDEVRPGHPGAGDRTARPRGPSSHAPR